MLTWMCCGLCVAVLAAEPGPTLTDADFFAGLNLSEPPLADVQTAVQKQDWTAARAAFAERFRSQFKTRWLAQPSPRKEPPAFDRGYADKVLAHQFRFSTGQWFDLGPKIDWGSSQMAEGESATKEWSSQLNRHFYFQDLAVAYRATGDEKYAAEIVAQMLSWIADCPLLNDRSGNSPYHHAWETLNTAIRAADTWPNALNQLLSSPSLTPDALCTILKSLVEHARHLDQWPSRSGNWLTAESKALYVIGTLLPEVRDANTWRQHAIERLAKQMETDVYPDGLEIELALGYSNWVLSNFSFVLDMAKQNGRADELPSDWLARLERMYDYLTYAAMPDGRVPGLNDSHNTSPTKLLKQGSQYFPERLDFLWAATRGERGTQPIKTSVAFPYSGHYVMRSGWDANARYLLLDAGPYGSGHQHEDKLHVIACAYGRQLLLDAGSYMYDHSRWRKYVLSTRGHNTIRVDQRDQNSRAVPDSRVLPQPFQPLKNTWVSNEQFDYAVGRYDYGYGPKPSTAVVHTRAIVFVKPNYWVLVDTLEPADSGEHGYESLFHLNAEKAAVEKDTQAVVTAEEKGANLILWPLSTAKIQTEIVQGLEEEPVQGWANEPWRPVPTAAIRAQGSGKLRLVTIVYPLAPGEKSPIQTAILPPVLTDGKPADDAVAIQIRFQNGSVHTLLVAEHPGVRHRCGDLDTTAEIQWTEEATGKKVSFHHP